MGNYYSTTCEPATYKRYGWKPDIPDHRDKVMFFDQEVIKSTPDSVDLRDRCPPVYNQQSLGSCTGNAIAAAYQFDELKQNNADGFMPSRLFIYYNERKAEGTIGSDHGASIRDGIKCINKTGVCHEDLWPYDITKFAVEPTANCYDDAKLHKSLKYHRIRQSSLHLKAALNAGYPIVFGISVYESMESPEVAKTGVIPMPTENDKLLGGHCILLVGYDNIKKQWIFRNSWGEEWGDKGYGYLPYKYIAPKSKLSSDFWVVETVSNE